MYLCMYVSSSYIFVFRLYPFVEAAALRSIVRRYAGVLIATRLFGDVAFSEYFFTPSLCMESTSYVISFRMVFFLPCDHGLDF